MKRCMPRRKVLLLGAMIYAVSCASVAQHRTSDTELTAARLLRIEDTRRDEPAFVDSLLAHPVASIRADAAITVGRIGARAHALRLRELAADADSSVAASSLFALAMLRDTLALPVAIAALHATPSVAREAAWLLGELGERSRTTIVAAIGDRSLASDARGALLLAAARLRPVPVNTVAALVASEDSAISWRAAYTLARTRNPAGVSSLLSALMSPIASVREQVARGIGKAVAGDSLGVHALKALALLTRDANPHVRINALRSAGSYGTRGRDLVLPALADSDIGARLAAAQQLDVVLDSSRAALSTLGNALARDTTFILQRTIAEAMVRRGESVPLLRLWQSSSEWNRRAASAEIELSHRAPAQSLAAAEPWLHDPDGRVRTAATALLAPAADTSSSRDSARARLRLLLGDADVGVRSAALGVLATRATLLDLAAALSSRQLADADIDNDARLAFWTLADSALRHSATPPPDSIERMLSALVRPADPIERVAAARLARFVAWRDSTGTARPIEWYEARARDRGTSRILRLETERGVMELELYTRDAPLTVHNLTTLAARGYFDGQRFHRVVPNFVVQAGDPRGDGNGGPGYAIRDEINRHRYERGTLGMALSGPNTGGSQFFVTHSPQPHLDGGYTVFGQLRTGEDILDHIVQGDRIVRVTVH